MCQMLAELYGLRGGGQQNMYSHHFVWPWLTDHLVTTQNSVIWKKKFHLLRHIICDHVENKN